MPPRAGARLIRSTIMALRTNPRTIAAFLAIASFASIASFGSTATADIYRYVDKDGVIHFTNTKKRGKKVAESSHKPRVGFMGSDHSDERYGRYDAHIREAASLYKIPEALVRAVIKVESNYHHDARSPVGAMGLMQLMPATAKRMQVTDITNPRQNIFGGVRYLRVLANLFNGSLVLTVASYNAGEGAVMKHGGIPPYAETQQYVTRVLHWYRRLQAAEVEAAQATRAESATVAERAANQPADPPTTEPVDPEPADRPRKN